jgi:hypothetical protein
MVPCCPDSLQAVSIRGLSAAQAAPRGLQVETLVEALRRRLTPKQLAELRELLNQAEPT